MVQLLSADGGGNFATTVLQTGKAERWKPTVRTNRSTRVKRFQTCAG